MLIVKKVQKYGVAKALGIKKGDIISKFDGFDAQDILDYVYYDSKPSFNITVIRKAEEHVLAVDKFEDDSLGLNFVSDNLEIKNCYNNCIFCFVDQMPKGMRPSLYVKDDDYRQSFLCGNFVTLTNVKDSDLDRIIRLNLSPMYVSVQATDPEVRVKLLNNRFAGDILDKLKKLTENGIKVETQVVLVPGVNDGAILDKTCTELFELGENLLSVAVVPCGITKFRKGLYPIEDITSGYASCVIEQARNLNAKFNKNFVTLGDEFYFKAGLPVESAEYYGDFLQVGNGVGVTAKFELELNESLRAVDKGGKYLLISGTSAAGFIKEQIEKIKKVAPVKADVLAVKNEFFGETVNCTGLLVGKDIISAVKPIASGYDALVLPSVCLRTGEDVFLDGVTLKELKKQTKLKIIVTDGSGESFFDALTHGNLVRTL